MQHEVETDAQQNPALEEANYTLDQVVMMNTIKRKVEALEKELDHILNVRQKRERRDPGQRMELSELEQAMKTVSRGWIEGVNRIEKRIDKNNEWKMNRNSE